MELSTEALGLMATHTPSSAAHCSRKLACRHSWHWNALDAYRQPALLHLHRDVRQESMHRAHHRFSIYIASMWCRVLIVLGVGKASALWCVEALERLDTETESPRAVYARRGPGRLCHGSLVSSESFGLCEICEALSTSVQFVFECRSMVVLSYGLSHSCLVKNYMP